MALRKVSGAIQKWVPGHTYVPILLFSKISFLMLFLQDPDPPTQDVHVVPPPMFNPNAFSKAQASPRKSRYPGIRNNWILILINNWRFWNICLEKNNVV